MKLYVITLIDQGAMIVKFTKLNITYAEEHFCRDNENAICSHINNSSYYGYIQNLLCFNNDFFDQYFKSI